MSFLSPLFLLGAFVAALPIALHLLGRRPQSRVLFPAVRLLKRAPARETRRRRLRELILLGLRVAAIVLLAAGFARPYLTPRASPLLPSTLVVALDRSFSMSGPGQFDRAIAAARRALLASSPGAQVALLAFDDDAQVLAGPTADRSAVLAALSRVRPGYGATSYARALARAAETLGAPGGRVLVVTDLQRGGWDRRDAAIPERVDVAVVDVGGPTTNVSVGDVRRLDSGIAAIVRNSGQARRTGRARLSVDGQPRGSVPFAVEGDVAQEISFSGPVPTTGEAMVEVDDAVGYEADNRAYALLDAPQPPDLLAVTGQGDQSRGVFYLQHALEVDNRRLFRLDSEPAARFSSEGTGAVGKYAAVILLGTRGMTPAAARDLAGYVAGGGGLLVVLDDQVEPGVLDELLGGHVSVSFEAPPQSAGPGIIVADLRHPILEPLDASALGGARFARVAHVAGGHDAVLARFADGTPALLERQSGGGRMLLFGSDLSNRWNDLPLQPAFLPLVHQIARYLVRDRLPARDFAVGAVPAGIDREPGVKTVPAMRAGSNALRPVSGRIVVNVDPRESDVARMTAAEFEQAIPRSGTGGPAHRAAGARQAEQQQGLWRLAIALAIFALLVEGLVGKTVTS